MGNSKDDSLIMRLERESFKRTIFVSLPGEEKLISFVMNSFLDRIKEEYIKIEPICYLDFEQTGDFTKIIAEEIAFSNGIVAFIKDLNNNVLIEIGRAMALGKPFIAIAPIGTDLPSLIDKELTIFYKGIIPTEEIKEALTAIGKAIVNPNRREKSNERARLQKRLLVGQKSLYKSNKKSLNKSEIKKGKLAVRQAESLCKKGNFAETIKILKKCIEKDYETQEVYHIMADTYFLLGEKATTQHEADKYYDDFLKTAEKGLLLFNNSKILRKDRGLALIKTGDHAEARRIFNQLLIESNSPVCLYNLACVHSLMSNNIECLRFLEQAMNQAKYYQSIARVDTDFEHMWENEMFQALIFQKKLK